MSASGTLHHDRMAVFPDFERCGGNDDPRKLDHDMGPVFIHPWSVGGRSVSREIMMAAACGEQAQTDKQRERSRFFHHCTSIRFSARK